MNSYRAKAIVLKRVDYAESDRIVTFITEKGKVSALVKGARKPNSKLAGGIELLAINDIHFLKGKGDLDHVISAKLGEHFRDILKDYDRLSSAYEYIGYIYKMTEESDEKAYFELLSKALKYLASDISLDVVDTWVYLQLLD